MAAVGVTLARNGLLIDPDMAAVGYFDDIFEDVRPKPATPRSAFCSRSSRSS
jgi:hypothetical protein